MPALSTTLHLDMLAQARAEAQPDRDGIYGLHWGNPDTNPVLIPIREHWLEPYVRADQDAVEIGPGGGRWTRYMLGFRRIFGVDYHPELLEELRSNFAQANILCILNNGDDFPTIPKDSISFIFSFGVFVHLEVDVIERYLSNMRDIIKKDANIIIQYSDKDKIQARKNSAFSENNPRLMRAIVYKTGYEIVEEDTTTLWHSSIIRFQRRSC
jgi:cyclopropane fatty-acyl-phospholipid synthase-like methyltransferase